MKTTKELLIESRNLLEELQSPGFELEFSMDGDVFQQNNIIKVTKIIHDVADRILREHAKGAQSRGYLSGEIKDEDGNLIGSWNLS